MTELCINCGQEALTDFRDDTYCKTCARKNMNGLRADLKGYELRLSYNLNDAISAFRDGYKIFALSPENSVWYNSEQEIKDIYKSNLFNAKNDHLYLIKHPMTDTETNQVVTDLGQMIKDIATADDVNWAINSYPDGNIIDENDVGYAMEKAGGLKTVIPHLKDGIYKVKQRNYNTGRDLLLKSKVLVSQGKIDIMSCKVAVAEFMNCTGDWHYFIESVSKVKNNKNTIRFRLVYSILHDFPKEQPNEL
tara:strand:- start:24 stop:770 length:747 start_codon:yes stop_codon:yes gene_type:complete